jgi:hypothetical protein
MLAAMEIMPRDPGFTQVVDENCDGTNLKATSPLVDFKLTSDFKSDLSYYQTGRGKDENVEASLLQRYSEIVVERKQACDSYESIFDLLQITKANRHAQTVTMDKQKALMEALKNKAKDMMVVQARNKKLEQTLEESQKIITDLELASSKQKTCLDALQSELAESITMKNMKEDDLQDCQQQIDKLALELVEANKVHQHSIEPNTINQDVETRALRSTIEELQHELEDQREMYKYVLNDQQDTEAFKVNYDAAMHQEVADLTLRTTVYKDDLHASLNQQIALMLQVRRLKGSLAEVEDGRQALARTCQELQAVMPSPEIVKSEYEAINTARQECDHYKMMNERMKGELGELISKYEQLNAQRLEKEQAVANEKLIRAQLEESHRQNCSDLREQLQKVNFEKVNIKAEFDKQAKHFELLKHSASMEYEKLRQTHASLISSFEKTKLESNTVELKQAKEEVHKLKNEIESLREESGKRERGYQRKCKSLKQQVEDISATQFSSQESKHLQAIKAANEKAQRLEVDKSILLEQIDDLLDLCEFPSDSERYSAQELVKANVNLKRSESEAKQNALLLEKTILEKEQTKAYLMSMYQSFQVSCTCQTGAWNMLPLVEDD